MILSFSKKFPWGEPTNFEDKILNGIKIHTIRTPRKGNVQWEPGRKIHFANGVRTPNYNCFKEGECTAVQDIKVTNRDSVFGMSQAIEVDGFMISVELAEQLAINDGFESLEEFFKWFDSDFTGKIIHWTDKRY